MATHYESDVTQFIQQYKRQHPDTEARQRAGRQRLWDQAIDLDRQEAEREATVPQMPYVYYHNP